VKSEADPDEGNLVKETATQHFRRLAKISKNDQ
jgi:hypothetical protein